VDNFRVRLSDVLEQSRTAFCENPFQMSASSKKSHSSMTHMGSSPLEIVDLPAETNLGREISRTQFLGEETCLRNAWKCGILPSALRCRVGLLRFGGRASRI